MKSAVRIAAFAALAALAAGPLPALADCPYSNWKAPGPDDVRGPCPMLNSLANHHFLPHSGRGISRNITQKALRDALNIGEEMSSFLFDFAIETNPEPNATVFSLENLATHNILEHDASLSRADHYYQPDQSVFNETVFDTVRAMWEGDTIDIKEAADSRLMRVQESTRENPEYSLSELGSSFSVGEVAAYILIFGDKTLGEVDKERVEFFFENERLPTHLGWKLPTELSEDDLELMMERIRNATDLPEEAKRKIKRGMHARPRL